MLVIFEYYMYPMKKYSSFYVTFAYIHISQGRMSEPTSTSSVAEQTDVAGVHEAISTNRLPHGIISSIKLSSRVSD